MSHHAYNLEMGAAVIGTSLANAIVANDQRRREERIAAEAEANSVASVRRLRSELAASLAREAALQDRLNSARFELLRTQAALRRAAAPAR